MNRLPVFEHPMFPADTSQMGEFELPLRVGLIFDTTLVAARLIYGGVFERYPNFPYIMAHTGGALLMMLERLDNGYRLFPDCRKYITKLPSHYGKRFYYDTCAFGESALMLATVPFVLFGLGRYLHLMARRDLGEEPDRVLLAAARAMALRRRHLGGEHVLEDARQCVPVGMQVC